MNVRDASAMIGAAVNRGETWADLGAGAGTFTAALAQLVGPAGTIIAVERDASLTRTLERLARQIITSSGTRIDVMRADFTAPLHLPDVDGILLANALHYVRAPDQARTLERLTLHLRAGGSLVVVEYDNRPPSRWVPYPIARSRLALLSRQAGLGAPEALGERASAFGGTIYAARLRSMPATRSVDSSGA